MSDKTLSFDKLVENVESVHAVTSSTAKGAVNQLLTNQPPHARDFSRE